MTSPPRAKLWRRIEFFDIKSIGRPWNLEQEQWSVVVWPVDVMKRHYIWKWNHPIPFLSFYSVRPWKVRIDRVVQFLVSCRSQINAVKDFIYAVHRGFELKKLSKFKFVCILYWLVRWQMNSGSYWGNQYELSYPSTNSTSNFCCFLGPNKQSAQNALYIFRELSSSANSPIIHIVCFQSYVSPAWYQSRFYYCYKDIVSELWSHILGGQFLIMLHNIQK